MSKPIDIHFAADHSALDKGISEINDELGTVSDSLDEVSDYANVLSDDWDKVGNKGKDAGRDVERGMDDAERSTKKAGEEAEGLGDALGGLGGIARDALEGDVTGAVEGVADTLGGLAGIIPGIGGLIGAGLGVVATELVASWDDAAKEVEERVAGMYEDLIASGNQYLSQQYLMQATADLFGDPKKLEEITKAAKVAGLAITDVAAAYAGDADAIKLVDQALDDAADAQLALQKAGEEYNTSTIVTARAAQDAIGNVAEATDNAGARAQGYADTVGKYADKWGAAEKKANDAKKAVDAIGDKDVKVKVSGDTSQLKADITAALATTRAIDLVVNAVDSYGRKLD